MSELSDYGLSCDYLREEFKLPKDVSLYILVNRITNAYKELKDTIYISKLEAEPTLKQEKKRGRPRKQ